MLSCGGGVIKQPIYRPPPTGHWENHPDLPEVIALQGRTEGDEAGEREEGEEEDDDEEEESSTEPEEEEEEGDRDADDDDEDEGFRESRRKREAAVPPGNLTVNMFNVLRENECE